MTRTHTPDFFAITADERARGYSSRCRICGARLVEGIELIDSPCPGGASEREIPPLDRLECGCGYVGGAAVVPPDGRGQWTAVCPQCRRAWIVEPS